MLKQILEFNSKINSLKFRANFVQIQPMNNCRPASEKLYKVPFSIQKASPKKKKYFQIMFGHQ